MTCPYTVPSQRVVHRFGKHEYTPFHKNPLFKDDRRISGFEIVLKRIQKKKFKITFIIWFKRWIGRHYLFTTEEINSGTLKHTRTNNSYLFQGKGDVTPFFYVTLEGFRTYSLSFDTEEPGTLQKRNTVNTFDTRP